MERLAKDGDPKVEELQLAKCVSKRQGTNFKKPCTGSPTPETLVEDPRQGQVQVLEFCLQCLVDSVTLPFKVLLEGCDYSFSGLKTAVRPPHKVFCFCNE